MKTVNPKWARIQELFNQAADMPLADRGAFLDKECGNDAGLRKELEALLSSDAGPPSNSPQSGIRASVLTQAVGLSLSKVQRDRRAELVGSVVGAYRLTSVLGHGGAGTVYLGERADRQYSARVAVKILDHTLHDDIAHRFLAERQILANLNHPHIAKLFDAGETGNSQPYLVMEYVHGEPVDRYCDNNKLTIKQRLQLFLKVCEAVQYAHQNLVVHRDLKPGNILVTPDGTPKLLDFGIAKLLDGQPNKAGPVTSQPLTRMNDRVLTPEYASPEQILGQNITTTSDVYALGIVLYELLAGTRPYQVNVVSQLELERIICILDPPWPTQVLQQIRDGKHQGLEIAKIAEARSISSKRLQHELDGDLDAITMRALRKEADQRYNSVEQLIDDVERYLSNAPVLARQGNWLYYSRRFVSRHWIGVSASAAVIVTLVATAAVLSYQNQRIKEQRDLANQESERAESVSNFMLDVFNSSDPFESQGKQVTAKELLDKAGAQINNDLTQQPEVRARLMANIGKAYQRQSQPEVAIKYLQDALQLLRNQPSTSTIVLAKSLDSLANAQRDAGDYGSAQASLTEAMSVLNKDAVDQKSVYLQVLTDLARVNLRQTKFQQSEQRFREALTVARTLYGNAHPETATLLGSLGQVMMYQGQLAAAVSFTREAVAIDHATLNENHPDRIAMDLALAIALSKLGKTDEATTISIDALNRLKFLYGSRNIKVSHALDILATLSQRKQQWDAAERYMREAVDITASALGSNNINTADLQTGLAQILIRRQRYREAEMELDKALVFLRSPQNQNSQYLASAEYMLADVYAYTHREKNAVALLQNNIPRWQQSTAPPGFLARSQNLLGWVQWNMKHDAASRKLLLDSYAAVKEANSGVSVDVIEDVRERTKSVVGDDVDNVNH
jgi:eukaryotic-like serine/threonine-protein kinase